MIKLCVNVDHAATLRQARGGVEPDPVYAAVLCQQAGADGITFHLREDRRHIQDKDVQSIREKVSVKLNMEMANTKEMVKLAGQFHPDQITLVPEKRQELTTEGGLDVLNNKTMIKNTVDKMRSKNIVVSLFIDPCIEQLTAAGETGVKCIELHTGEYTNAVGGADKKKELSKLFRAAEYAHSLDLIVYAGHGLNYENTQDILKMPYLEEVNIGHSIISRAVIVGIADAVKEMKNILNLNISE